MYLHNHQLCVLFLPHIYYAYIDDALDTVELDSLVYHQNDLHYNDELPLSYFHHILRILLVAGDGIEPPTWSL